MKALRKNHGVALVTTLIMLSIITLMTVAFLAISRRDKASVTVVKEIAKAQQAAAMAIERAKAEVASRMLTSSNLLDYDVLVATNWTDPDGYDLDLDGLAQLQYDARPPVIYDVKNISQQTVGQDFRYWLDLNRNGEFEPTGLYQVEDGSIRQLVGDPQWIGVLEDPSRPHGPDNRFIGRYTFIVLPTGKSLDLNYIHNQAKRLSRGADQESFNRSQGVGSWELNLAGFFRELNTNYWSYGTFTPQKFLADGSRVGELPTSGTAFSDAKDLLNYRYRINQGSAAPGWPNLEPVGQTFGLAAARAETSFSVDGIDNFSDGGLGFGDNDDSVVAAEAWPGAASTNAFFDPQELFRPGRNYSGNGRFSDRLLTAGALGATSYDSYTFYRMLSQMGVDSVPADRDKINLNYNNAAELESAPTNLLTDIYRTQDFMDWRPQDFFNVAADRILRDEFPGRGLSITNIPLDLYTEGTLFQKLQLVANIYEAGYHGAALELDFRYGNAAGMEFPRVYQPLVRSRVVGGEQEFYVSGFVPITGAAQVTGATWVDLDTQAGRDAIANNPANTFMVTGAPLIIGARKGLPNFNELSLQTIVSASRRLQFSEGRGGTISTNQQYVFSISNRVDMELWNSYAQPFDRDVRIVATNRTSWAILDRNDRVVWPNAMLYPNHVAREVSQHTGNAPILVPAGSWAGTATGGDGNFIFPLRGTVPASASANINFEILPRLKYTERTDAPELSFDQTGNPLWDFGEFPVPEIRLVVTNRFNAMIYDDATGAVLDFVNAGNMVREFDINEELLGNPSAFNGEPAGYGAYWDPTRVNGNQNDLSSPTEGIFRQIQVSLGNINESSWNPDQSGDSTSPTVQDQIDKFRVWFDLSPIYNTQFPPVPDIGPTQAPYTPTRRLVDVVTLQVNDPLVHYTMDDLRDTQNSEVSVIIPPNSDAELFMTEGHSIGRINDRYQPWGGNPQTSSSGDRFAYNMTVKDPGVFSSDYWDFPDNKFANLGVLGAVHRGTPWQTVYLKSNGGDAAQSAALNTRAWRLYSLHTPVSTLLPVTNIFGVQLDTEEGMPMWTNVITSSDPMIDWGLMDIFTTAVNDNAARGLLGVNQTNLAAWSAVLGGVTVLSDGRRDTTDASFPDANSEVVIAPATANFRELVDGENGINQARLASRGGRFQEAGDLLRASALTMDSPYIDWTSLKTQNNPISAAQNLVTDEVVESIPRQILSLVKSDAPVVTVFAYGEALQPASPNAIYRGLGPYNGMVTNYNVSARFVIKEVIEMSGKPEVSEGGVQAKVLSHNVIYEE